MGKVISWDPAQTIVVKLQLARELLARLEFRKRREWVLQLLLLRRRERGSLQGRELAPLLWLLPLELPLRAQLRRESLQSQPGFPQLVPLSLQRVPRPWLLLPLALLPPQ